MPAEPRLQTNLPSIQKLRAATSPAGVPPFRVGIVIGPGYIPMDMVGVQTVFGLMPGAEIHLLWKSTELVEGFPNWWTKPTTAFADCPTLDVFAVPMLPPEIQNAIRDKRPAVGMDREMVLAAVGRPDRKVREKGADGSEIEDWIYGKPPAKTVFVKFDGDKVVQVEQFPQ